MVPPSLLLVIVTFDGMGSGLLRIDQPGWKAVMCKKTVTFHNKSTCKNNFKNPDPQKKKKIQILHYCQSLEKKTKNKRKSKGVETGSEEVREKNILPVEEKGVCGFWLEIVSQPLDTSGNLLDMLCFHSARWPWARSAKDLSSI